MINNYNRMTSNNYKNIITTRRGPILLLTILLLILFQMMSSINNHCVNGQIQISQIGQPFTHIEGLWRYYKLPVATVLAASDQGNYLTFALSVYYGDAQMHIAVDKEPDGPPCTVCILESKESYLYTDLKRISITDGAFPKTANSTLYVGIYASVASKYTFNTYTASTPIYILNSNPQFIFVKKNQKLNFVYHENESFYVSVSSLDSQSYLYISPASNSSSGTPKFPTSDDNTWNVTTFGFDAISVYKSDPMFVDDSDYYLSVQSDFDTYFYLSASTEKSYAELVPNVPMTVPLPRDTYRYFHFYSTSKQTVTIKTISTMGQSIPIEIFVTRDISSAVGPPSRFNKEWSRQTDSTIPLTIETEAGRDYYVSFLQYSSDATIQVMLTTNVGRLADGITQPAYLSANSIDFYQFTLTHATKELQFVVHNSPGCSIEMYAEVNSLPMPGRGTKVGELHDANQRVITYDKSPTSRTHYFVSVSTTSVAGCQYSIMASTSQSYIFLTDGVPVINVQVTKGLYRYFIFDSPAKTSQELYVTASPAYGDVELYAATGEMKPGRGSYSWVSTDKRIEFITIRPNDSKKNGKNRLFISVYGGDHPIVTGSCYFTIQATLENTELKLEDGSAIAAVVSKNAYRYFHFQVKTLGDALVTVDVDSPLNTIGCYISKRNKKPSEVRKDAETMNYGTNYALISNEATGHLHIGLKGLTRESYIAFHITVELTTKYLRLNRQTTLQSAQINRQNRFYTNIPTQADFVVIAVSTVFGKTSLYVNTDSREPTTTDSDIVNTQWPINAILVNRNDPVFRTGLWSILVRAEESTNYFLSVSSNNEPILAQPSIPLIGMLPAGTNTSLIYEYQLVDDALLETTGNYELIVRCLRGSISVYISQDGDPGPSLFTFSSTGRSDRVMILTRDKLRFGVAMYVRVVGDASNIANAIFELTLYLPTAYHLLSQDQPTIQTLKTQSDMTYLQVLTPTKIQTNCYIESCDKYQAPRFYTNSDGNLPKKGLSDIESKLDGAYVQVGKANFNPDGPVYIGVDTNSNSELATEYTSYATTRDRRPVISNRKLSISVGNQATITFEAAAGNPMYQKEPFIYDVYMKRVEVSSGNQPEVLNYNTLCSLKNNGDFLGEATLINGTNRYTFKTDRIDRSLVYRVNVVAHNGLGLGSSYSPMWIIEGTAEEEFVGVTGKMNISAICIVSFLGIVWLYLLIGGAINFLRKKRGINMIPNLDFWIDFPFLVIDGVKLFFDVFECGLLGIKWMFRCLRRRSKDRRPHIEQSPLTHPSSMINNDPTENDATTMTDYL